MDQASENQRNWERWTVLQSWLEVRSTARIHNSTSSLRNNSFQCKKWCYVWLFPLLVGSSNGRSCLWCRNCRFELLLRCRLLWVHFSNLSIFIFLAWKFKFPDWTINYTCCIRRFSIKLRISNPRKPSSIHWRCNSWTTILPIWKWLQTMEKNCVYG